MSGVRAKLLAAALALAVAACGSGGIKEDPLLALSAEEALAEGKRLMEAEKFRQAEEYLSHAFEVEPNSPTGREALLLAADALYLAGGEQNYIRAEAKYRDFQNRFPTSERGDYIMFQIANSLAERMAKPDRDQTTSLKALKAYDDLIAIFPTSEYVEPAREQIARVRATLAESEFLVGRFYHRTGLHKAAVARFQVVLDDYPDYPEIDRVLYLQGSSYLKMEMFEEARRAFAQLRAEFPDSAFVSEIPAIPEADEESQG